MYDPSKDRVLQPGTVFDSNSIEHKAFLRGAINHYLSKPDRMERVANVSAFTTSGDFPTLNTDIIQRNLAMAGAWDDMFERVFSIRDFTGTKRDGFRLGQVNSGVVFADVTPEGREIKINKISGEDVTVYFKTYAGGLSWRWEDMQDGDLLDLEAAAMALRNGAYKTRSDVFYGLIEAVASTYDVAWQNPLPATLPNTTDNYVINRDAQTIYKAVNDLLEDCVDIFDDVTATSPVVIVTPKSLESRITAALGATQQQYPGSPKMVNHTINVIPTLALSASTSYYVILPGRKMQGGYRHNLSLMDFDNKRALVEGQIGVMRYAGVIGEIKQIRRCAIS